MTMYRAATRALAAGVLPFVVLVPACRGKESVASKSAAQYDEAQRKGTAVAGNEGHAGHGVAPSGASPAPEGPHAGHGAAAVEPRERAAHAGHSGMAGIDRAHAPASPRADHAAHAPSATAQAGHGAHTSAATASQPAGTAEMDHASMGHAGIAHVSATPMAPPRPIPAAATASPGQPAATLRSDAIDAPAPTSVGDAARSAAMAAEMAAGGHAMPHGTYTHTDAGRDSIDPHHMHAPAPSPRPSPFPRNEEDER